MSDQRAGRDRDALAAELSERLKSLAETDDPTSVTDPVVPDMARRLAQVLPQDATDDGDVRAMGLLVAVHFARFQALPPGQDWDDLQACRTWSLRLLPVAPHLIPGPLRDHLTGRGAANSAASDAVQAVALVETYQRTGHLDHLDTATTLFRQAVDVTPDGHPQRPVVLSGLGFALLARYERTGRQADLEEAVTVGQQASAVTPDGHPQRPVVLAGLGLALQASYERTGRQADLEEAVTVGQQASAVTPDGHPQRPVVLASLGRVLLARYERTGQQADLEEAVNVGRQAVDVTPDGHPDRAAVLSNLKLALQARYGRTGQQADLEEAVNVGRQAVDAAPDNHPDRPRYLSNLGNALQAQYERTGRLADLDEAVAVFRRALQATPDDHPARPAVLSNLGIALWTRCGRAGQQADLEEAVALFRAAVQATPDDHPARPRYLSNLGNALKAQYERTGRQADLDEAVDVGRQAVDLGLQAKQAIPDDHPERAGRLSNLGDTLRAQYERTGRQADLEEAVALFRQAKEATPPDHPDRPRYLSNLGITLQARYERTGRQADLDEAVSVLRETIQDTPVDHPDRGGMLSNLGIALWTRHGRASQQADLDEAVTLFREAVHATPPDDPHLPRYLSNLGIALQDQYERSGRSADLDEAVDVGQQAVHVTPPDHPDRSGTLSNLGMALRTRFARRGEQTDLDEAITVGRRAVAAAPSDHPDRVMYLSNLGGTLQTRYGHTGQKTDLDEAITVGRQAVAFTPPDHPDRARYLTNLGTALQTRFERAGQQADLDAAVSVCREGAGVGTSSPGRRLAAARQWGRYASLASDWDTAVQGYAAAIALLPLTAWHGLDQATREHHLREYGGLAGEAATAAVLAGDPVRAVELLDAGRAMLWTQALHLRQDLDRLQRQCPDLAERLDTARAVLDPSPPHPTETPTVPGDLSDHDRASRQRMLENRRRAAQDWDTAVEQVRGLEGFEDFLRPVPFTKLRPAAADGPVVIVNVSPHGSHALVVSPDTVTRPGSEPGRGVVVVDLPTATWEAVINQTDTLRAARHRAAQYWAGGPTADWNLHEDDRYAVFDVLAWTWTAVTEPVLAALGHTATPTDPVEEWPRVWWCPTGPATVLPLHAAGIHPRTDIQHATALREASAVADSVFGRVVSSYTPTLTALTRSRTRPAEGQQVHLLAVGVPNVPGLRPLPGVLPELHAIADALANGAPTTYLTSPTPTTPTFPVHALPTREAVAGALPDHSWLHLSCHAAQHPRDASRSAFFLHDGPLTLARLAALDLPNADLAYLAACQTATGDTRLLDEALHLAAALQLVGYRHVLATLWNVSDAAAPEMAHAVYAHLAHPDPNRSDPTDQPNSARAAHALHHAVTLLRRTCPGEPLIWAPYIHLGP